MSTTSVPAVEGWFTTTAAPTAASFLPSALPSPRVLLPLLRVAPTATLPLALVAGPLRAQGADEGPSVASDSVARRLLGSDRVIGVSAHSADDVVRAESDGADFAVLGPIYETPSKRQYGEPLGLRVLEEAGRRCRIPVFAIGGITVARVAEVRRAGAYGVAVVSAILSAASAEAATRQLLDALARA